MRQAMEKGKVTADENGEDQREQPENLCRGV